jgi:hypothetical protein
MNKIVTEHGIFTSNEITGQTAEEVYQEWLENKDKPPKPTEMEIQQQIINTLGQELAQLKLKIVMGGM